MPLLLELIPPVTAATALRICCSFAEGKRVSALGRVGRTLLLLGPPVTYLAGCSVVVVVVVVVEGG